VLTDLKIDYSTVDPNLGSVVGDYENVIPSNNIILFGDTPLPSRWHRMGPQISDGLEYSVFNLAPGQSRTVYLNTAPIFAAGQTMTAQVTLSSATWTGINQSASAATYILQTAPTCVPPGSGTTPTPVAALGKIVTFPQPAMDKLCFGFTAPAAGPVKIVIYNAALQLVGRVDDQAVGGIFETACVDISGLASGVYFYKAKVGDFDFGMQSFGIAR
jgi:hypothetical protein